MSFLSNFGLLFQALCRFVGLSATAAAAGIEPPPAADATRSFGGPAVAGFVKRASVDEFLLARRLASVARLNTPSGRKPRIAPKPKTDLPPVPAARLGAKKTRINGNHGMRVLRPAVAAQRPASNILPFPVAKAASENSHTRLGQAA